MIAFDELRGFGHIVNTLRARLVQAPEVDVGEWHSQKITGVPQLVSRELQDVSFSIDVPDNSAVLQQIVKPNLPWAENHFEERVSGLPLNPPPSAAEWPFAQQGHEAHTEGGKFSHTYPERFWPKLAMDEFFWFSEQSAGIAAGENMKGIRFKYGDLMDVVNLLHRSPSTRQAYLPVWFPEDTGAVHGERVPCSLGYHFMIRNGELSITYMIRSCDFVRHFNDDVYLAARLCQWVQQQLVDRDEPEGLPVPRGLRPGQLTMHIMSLHIFEGDVAKLTKEVEGNV